MDHSALPWTDRPPVRVAVDLSHLRPGGENGGIKPFLFETLLWLGRQRRAPLRFFYLTCASTHAEVCEQLARLEDEVICVRADEVSLPDGEGQVPRERLAVPPPLDLLTRFGVQVLYCPFGAVEFATPGIGTISTIVDVLHRDFPWSLGPHHNAEREQAFQRIVAVADALQCNSEHVISRMHEHYGVSPERMFTVYNAVHRRFSVLSPAKEQEASRRADDAAGLPASPFFFYPANFWVHKNHEMLLVAYGIYRAGALARGETPWPLMLTGHEDARWQVMRALALSLNLLGAGGVHFAGYLPSHAFGRLWDQAGALVFPSLHEGFGIPLLEAMEHGVPILCSREGSLPEVGADACLFVNARRPEELAAALTRLATDDALRQQLVTAGRRRLADFSQDRESGHLLAAIATLAHTPSYHPLHQGISADGWMEDLALLALPGPPPGGPMPGRLTLRFHSLPVARRLRLHAGASVALGSFALPPYQANHEISVDFQPAGGALRVEVPDAANLDPNDVRAHGVHLCSIRLRLANGQEYSLFSTE